MAASKFEKKSADVLNLLCQGYNYGEACKKVGIDRTTLENWMKANSSFSAEVTRARKEGEQRSIEDVEAALLDLAKGYEYEEVRTEYESKLNEQSGKYEPTIKKQVRTKKRVIASTEAIKFYLTNKAPDIWKNRLDQNTTGNLVTDMKIRYVGDDGEDVFPSSEAEVDGERGV